MNRRTLALTVAALSIVGLVVVLIGPAWAPGPLGRDDPEPMEEIACDVFYLPNPSAPSEQRTLVQTPATGAPQPTATARFGELTFFMSYFDDGFDSPALQLWAKSPGRKRRIASRLYQFERSAEAGSPAARPENEFAGGHGFTGLGYVYDVNSRAEIQFFCTAS